MGADEDEEGAATDDDEEEVDSFLFTRLTAPLLMVSFELAMNKFVNEDFKEALEGLLPVQGSLWRMGGSIAQRDIIELTTAVAAIRAGEKNIALSLPTNSTYLVLNTGIPASFHI